MQKTNKNAELYFLVTSIRTQGTSNFLCLFNLNHNEILNG